MEPIYSRVLKTGNAGEVVLKKKNDSYLFMFASNK
jgi:hypothetical protein